MSYKTILYEWDVSPTEDQIGILVGYEFEFRKSSWNSPIMYHLSTFNDNAVEGAFYYSLDGENFTSFPLGEAGTAFYSDYTMRVVISSAMSGNIFSLSDGVIYRLAADSSKIIERFDTGVDLQFLSIDHRRNDIYGYYNDTLYSFYTTDKLRFKRSFKLSADTLEIVVDGARGVFWQVTKNAVFKRSIEDAEIFSTYSLGSTILSDVKKFLDKINGNIVISATTSSGYEIFEFDYYSSSFTSDTSSNLILDIDRGESGYFVTFGNQYLGEYSSGTLDETYIDTGRSEVKNVSGDQSLFYLTDSSSDEIVKFTLPYTEEWTFNQDINENAQLLARGSDSSVIYSEENLIACVRDDGVDLKRLEIPGSLVSFEVSGQANPSHSEFRYRAVYGSEALELSSSSSSSSSSGGYSSSSSSNSSSSSSSSIDSSSSSSSSIDSSSSSSGSSSSSSSSEGYSSSSSSEMFSESSSTSSEAYSSSSSS